jgi:exodeoxyribonuclease V beta subunit
VSATWPRWSPVGPLERGVTLLEASAGTGKTHGLTDVIARLIAEEGLKVGRILVLTYTEAATAELRDRVRTRLGDLAGRLGAVAAGEADPDAARDPVAAHLVAQARARGGIDAWRRRLLVAHASFDEAPISTIHAFCRRTLERNAVDTDQDLEVSIGPESPALLEEIVDDFWGCEVASRGLHFVQTLADQKGSRTRLLCLARLLARHADLAIDTDVPADADLEGVLATDPGRVREALEVRFVAFFRRELRARKANTGELSFDDLLVNLRDALRRDVHGRVRVQVRRELDAALVDEFQDTDPVQWEILSTLFGADAWLWLVGDPKQAIYGFRGADVHAYLRARAAAGERRFTLTANWRSDARLVQALHGLFDQDNLFLEAGIDYVPVQPVAREPADRLQVAGGPGPALDVRLFWRAKGRRGGEKRGSAWPGLPHQVAVDVLELLEGDTRIFDPGRDEFRPLVPADIAVLVHTNLAGNRIQAALLRAGVPAVVGGGTSVFASVEAEALARLMDALLHPGHDGLARAAFATPILGLSGDALGAMDDETWERRREQLAEWSARWGQEGFLPVFRAITAEEGTLERLVGQRGGERTITNLLHLCELAHAAATRERLGPAALAGWLRQARLDPSTEQRGEELRLESDADAVTISTIHRSKGLEFPIVLCPTLWEGDARHLPATHHAADPARTLTLDLRGGGGNDATKKRRTREQNAERMRLAYVALTRARHRCVVYWGVFDAFERSPLARLLHPGRGAPDANGWALGGKVDDDVLHADLEARAAASEGALAVTRVRGEAPNHGLERPLAQGELRARTFARTRIDRWWRRVSYSSLTRGALVAAEGSPQAEGRDHDTEASEGARDTATTLGLFGRLRGTAAGTFLHACLERLDFSDVDHPSALREFVAARMRTFGIAAEHLDGVCAGLGAALAAPLGGPLGNFALRELRRADRLDELGFELPLAGGFAATPGRDHVRPAAIAALFRRHSQGLCARWLERLGGLAGAPARGFLTGAIDLVFRREVDGRPRYFVVDWKSNHLAAGYGPDALRDAMTAHHYWLQYHLYLVALHRYLRWRVPGYDPERDLGGAYYLFLRGMTGTAAPEAGEVGPGVFFDRPPWARLEELDGLLAVPGRVDPLEIAGGAA